jgi:glycosyltransferase involved in cell wall biosynthesis
MKYEKFNPIVKLFIPLVMHFIRNWDRSSSKRVDYFIANSGFVAQRIKKYYGRDSVVINPPVDTGKFIPSGKVSDYFLAVSRLVPQKRTDIIIEAFNRLKLPLKVIGKGRDLPGLKKTAGANTEFLGFVPENELCGYMSGCRALVFASLEDFGIVPLEAGSCGRPVIAYGKGGVVDSVVDGRTGIFFDEQTPEAIIDAVNRFQKIRFDPSYIRQFALKFGKEEFAGKLQRYIEEKYNEYKGNTQ